MNTQLGSHSHLLRIHCCSIVLFVVDLLFLYSSLYLIVVLTISSLPLSAPTLKSHLTLPTLPFLSVSLLTVYNFLSHYLKSNVLFSPSPYDLKQTKIFQVVNVHVQLNNKNKMFKLEFNIKLLRLRSNTNTLSNLYQVYYQARLIWTSDPNSKLISLDKI